MPRKALLAIAVFALALCAAFTGGRFAGAEQAPLVPKSLDGKIKAYYSSPMCAAHYGTDGAEMVIAGEAGKLVVYVNDGEGESVYEKEIAVENPFKMEVFSGYLFVYDYLFNTSLSIYDLSDPRDITFYDTFSHESRPIGDFSIAGSELLLLSANTVYRYELEADDGLNMRASGSSALSAGLVTDIVALGEGKFAYLNNAGDLAETDMQGSYTKPIGERSSKSYINHFEGKLYYLHNYSEIVRHDLQTAAKDSLPLNDNGGRPLSRHIASVQSLFVDADGVYVLDGQNKKVVKLDHSLAFTGFCLDSFSFEAGRFNAPQAVSASLSRLIVADKGRVQILGEGAPQSVITGITADFALMSPEGKLFLIAGGKVYLYEGGNAVEIAQIDDIRDVKIYSGGLYVLTGSALYFLTEEGEQAELLGALPLGEPKKLAINEKSGSIYILAGGQITVYGSDLRLERSVDAAGPVFAAMETDFMGNIYLLSQSGIIRIDEQGQTAFGFSGVKLGNLCGLAIDPISGKVYFASKDAHEVYYCEKEELGVKVAGDIPEIALPSDPLQGGDGYEAKVIKVLGYPSTLFYPFSESAKGQPFYPEGLAHEGGLKYIPQGAKLLSVLNLGEYRLAFFEGKLGFVLSDRLEEIGEEEPQFEQGFALTGCDVYVFPYGGEVLKKGALQKFGEVRLLSLLPDFDESEFAFAKVEYAGGGEGYVCLSFIAEKQPEFERPYVAAQVYSGSGKVPVYGGDKETVIFTLDDFAEVKVYYFKGEYAFVSFEGGWGYVRAAHIAEDKAFERQRTGFFMLIGTLAVGAFFWIIKKKYLTV